MNSIFKNTELQADFDKKGYITFNAFSAAECDEILAFHATLSPGLNDRFFATQNSANYAYRKAVEDYLHPRFEKLIEPLFVNHRVLYTQFMVKHSGADGECRMHQDWNFVDEPRHHAVNFWCALSDTDTHNGCLWMMPGSHRLKTRIRGRNIERPSLKEEDFIRRFLLKPVLLKKGQAVLFNAATLHESRSNLSSTDRIAAAAMIIPKNVKTIHYLAKEPGSTELLMVDADTPFYIENSGLEMPANLSVIGQLEHANKPYSKTELLRSYFATKF